MFRWKTRRRTARAHGAGGRLAAALGVVALFAIALFVAAPVDLGARTQTPDQDFGPPTDIARDSLPALPLLYVAYGFAWVAVLAYVLMLWRRLAHVERELADVQGRIARRSR